MDEIERNLIEAWDKVVARCKADPEFREKREAMGRRQMMRQPMRAWCLALRASDRRIGPWHFYVSPTGAMEAKEPHEVTLEARGIAAVTRPVCNPFPGMRAVDAARRLGISFEIMMRWARKGANGIHLEHYRPGSDGYWGNPSPWVWWEGSLDPQHMEGSPPDGFWGSAWRTLSERVPAEFNQTVQRLPRWRDDPIRGRVFCGWDWKCPGLVDRIGLWCNCGRISRWLYAAVPVWRVQDFLGESPGVTLPPQAGMWEEQMRFTCKECVGWTGMHGTDKDPGYAWNQFVRHMSGGLLTGREVKKPAWLRAWKRKKRYSKREGRK